MHALGFTGLTQVKVGADGALVAETHDRSGLAAITDNAVVHSALLLLTATAILALLSLTLLAWAAITQHLSQGSSHTGIAHHVEQEG
jgi:hypothetical protein